MPRLHTLYAYREGGMQHQSLRFASMEWMSERRGYLKVGVWHALANLLLELEDLLLGVTDNLSRLNGTKFLRNLEPSVVALPPKWLHGPAASCVARTLVLYIQAFHPIVHNHDVLDQRSVLNSSQMI
jgi:hypothetical protein